MFHLKLAFTHFKRCSPCFFSHFTLCSVVCVKGH